MSLSACGQWVCVDLYIHKAYDTVRGVFMSVLECGSCPCFALVFVGNVTLCEAFRCPFKNKDNECATAFMPVSIVTLFEKP